MKDIDWSKAPEGATHFHTPFFYRVHGDSCEYMSSRWKRSFYTPTQLVRNATCIARPATPRWDGTGLPPIGVVCEYSFGGDTWHECHVRHVLDNDPSLDADGWQAVVWCPHLEKEQVARLPLFKFRPIRTPEQIAVEERDAAIASMTTRFALYTHNDVSWRALFAQMYDCGCRMTAEDER